MATSEAKEIKKQETLVRFSIISCKTRLRVPYLSIISWILLLPYILKEWQILLANTILEKRLASSAYYPISSFPVWIFLLPELHRS